MCQDLYDQLTDLTKYSRDELLLRDAAVVETLEMIKKDIQQHIKAHKEQLSGFPEVQPFIVYGMEQTLMIINRYIAIKKLAWAERGEIQ